MTLRRCLAVAAVVAVVTSAAAWVGAARPPRPSGHPAALVVTGDVDDLHPGSSVMLPLTVANPYPFAVEVHSVDVVAADGGPGCSSDVLAIGPAPDGQTIPARESGLVPVPLQMLASAPDACQKVTLPLSYIVTVGRAG